jgi:methylated-DNA-protein-cysteine methyltransferase related protein
MAHVYTEIYKIVQSIPKGRVLTYGLISNMIGGRMSAQGVGWALKALGSAKRAEKSSKRGAAKSTRLEENISAPNAKKPRGQKKDVPFCVESVPWQRVVNSKGGTSTHKIGDIPPGFQQHLLELEGLVFDEEGQIDLDKYLWVEGVSK